MKKYGRFGKPPKVIVKNRKINVKTGNLSIRGIESLGWKIFLFNENNFFIGNFMLHIDIQGIISIINTKSETNIIKINGGVLMKTVYNREIIFNGTLKNKSELQKVMVKSNIKQ